MSFGGTWTWTKVKHSSRWTMRMSHHFSKKLGESSPKWRFELQEFGAGHFHASTHSNCLESGHLFHLRGVTLFGKLEGWSLLFTSSNASRLQTLESRIRKENPDVMDWYWWWFLMRWFKHMTLGDDDVVIWFWLSLVWWIFELYGFSKYLHFEDKSHKSKKSRFWWPWKFSISCMNKKHNKCIYIYINKYV